MMIHFLFKGLWRDRSRSLLPTIVVSIGVFVIVLMCGLMDGMMNNMMNTTAHFSAGHVKVMTHAYEKEMDQQPLDLAMLNADDVLRHLKSDYPDLDWTPRISFGMLLDVPDAKGESLGQVPVSAMAYDLLGNSSAESQRIGLDRALVQGRPITQEGEILVTHDLATRFQLKEGSLVTLFGSDMNGSMTFANRTVVGVIRTGIAALDRGAIVTDIRDARTLLDMEGASTMILGFVRNDIYDNDRCAAIQQHFNARQDTTDLYAPVMLTLRDQDSMGEMMAYMDQMSWLMLILLLIALSLVLWNTGVLGGIRRYGEFGVRIAIGESKKHIVVTLLTESVIIGLVGSFLGTFLGLLASYYLQQVGLDYSAVMENMSMMVNPLIRSEISPYMYYIGFIPGLLSVVAGTALASRGVFKRKTASLFKELD